MVRNSYKKLDENISDKLKRFLFYLLGNKTSKKEFETVIESIFSNAEKIMILKRIGIFYLLLKGIEKYKIKKVIKVTRATIDKFNLIIEKNPKLYKNFDKLIKKENIIQLFEEIIISIYGPGTPGLDWNESLKRKRKLISKKEIGL